MKRLIIIAILTLGTIVSVYSQNPNATPTPSIQEESRRAMEDRQKVQQDYERLKKVGEFPVANKSAKVAPPTSGITKEQAARLVPDKEDSAKYADFLKQSKTGLVKLFPDLGCWAKDLIRVDGICQDAIPQSSYYSFRKEKRSGGKAFSDVGLKDNMFFTDGWKSNGIMVNLGNVPVENISPNSDGIKFLLDYKSASEEKDISTNSLEAAKGIKFGDYIYSNLVPVLENNTYAVRVIAYRGKLMTPGGLNLFDLDKRIDIIVVFQVVRMDKDGIVTLLWRELQRKDSPQIKFSKEDGENLKPTT